MKIYGTDISILKSEDDLTLEEEIYLAKVADEAMQEYLANPVTYTHKQVMQELGITHEELDAITDEEMEAFCKGTDK